MTTATMLTTADLLAMPEDGTDRWLVRGELRERPWTVKDHLHCLATTKVSVYVANWVDDQPKPHGVVLAGNAGVQLPGEPETTIGIDVVYVSPEVLSRQPDDATIIVGVPTLAVEILSPNDTQEYINEKIDALLTARVPLVWEINPHRRTVTVRRPGEEPETFNAHQELSGEAHLSGFRVPVASLFE